MFLNEKLMKENIKNVKNGKEIIIIIALIILFLITFIYEATRIQKLNGDETTKITAYIILAILCAITFLFALYFYHKKDIKPEKAFLIVVPLFCILLSIAMPMSKGHDETIHGLRIYEYAEGKIISNGEKAYLEEGVVNALDNKPTYESIFNYGKTYDKNTEIIETGYRISSYSPITYLPQVVGIIIGRTITNNSIIHVYLARLANIVTCVVMLYFAIKFIPFGKNMMFLLCLIPISIEGFSTLSADGIAISAAFLWVAYILKLREEKDKKITKKEIIGLILLGILVAISKTIYIVLLPLLLLIPKEKFTTKKRKVLFIITTFLIGTIIDLAWYKFGIQKQSISETTEVNSIMYILLDPINYIVKIVYTIITNLGKYLEEIFGGKLEWNEAVTIPMFPIILFTLGIISSKLGKEKIKFKLWEKIIILLIIISCIGLVFTGMYIFWSDKSISTIQGIQGRYFAPIIPLVFLLFGGSFLDNSKITRIIAITGIIMQICVIMELVLYHI